MADYVFPKMSKPHKVKKNQVLLVASGDLRPRPTKCVGPPSRRWSER